MATATAELTAHNPLVWGRQMDTGSVPSISVPAFRRAPELPERQAAGQQWTVHSVIGHGWREMVTFESSGIAIFGDFVIDKTASMDICTKDLFFMQIMLEGHDVFPSACVGRPATGGNMIVGRFRREEDTGFLLPKGGRWRSLFIALSDGATEHMWGMTPDRLMALLRRGMTVQKAPGVELAVYDSPLRLSETTRLKQIFGCTLAMPLRKAFLWSKSLELMTGVVSTLLTREASPRTAPSRSVDAVMKAREIIHRELSRPHTIDSLCYRVGLNRRSFVVSFRKCFGVTFHEYYTQLRLSEALALLCGGGYKVCDVARAVGYSQHSSFSRAFKSFHGFSPCQMVDGRD